MKTQTIKNHEIQKLASIECNICLFDSSIAKIHLEEGVCEYCKLQEKLRANAKPHEWPNVLEKIRKSGKGKQYDCLIGISGGEDSSVLLYMAVKIWALRPLVIHFNNRSNRPEADNNIRVLTSKLGVNFIEYFVDQKEYDDLTDSFLAAGVQDADIANDIAMAKLMYSASRQYGIKYILNGHDFAHEGSSPAAWSYMDAKYVQSVYKKWTGRQLQNYPLYTFWDQIVSGFLGIKQVRPYHYMPDFNRGTVLQDLFNMGWKDYGGKHNENIYTAFVGNYLLPKKFHIDKRRTYLSAQIREGYITKEYAKEILLEPAEFDLTDLGDKAIEILALINLRKGNRSDYEKYNFKRWKPLIWLLWKMGIVAQTFYFKYTK
jgi:hypothetical protein